MKPNIFMQDCTHNTGCCQHLYPKKTTQYEVLIGELVAAYKRLRSHETTTKKEISEDPSNNLSNYTRYLENARDGVFITDRLGRFIEANTAVCSITGYIKCDLLQLSIVDLPAEESSPVLSAWGGLFETGTATLEGIFNHKNGTQRWWSLQALQISATRAIVFIKDITEHKQAEISLKTHLAEKELILKEVHHRIKNNMNAIFGLLSLQANTLTNTEASSALNDACNRVKSMQILYEKLFMTDTFCEAPVLDYISALIDMILNSWPDSKTPTVEKNIDDFVMKATQLQPLGMIINELLTNILKYAFTDNTRGNISVTAAYSGETCHRFRSMPAA